MNKKIRVSIKEQGVSVWLNANGASMSVQNRWSYFYIF